MVCRSQAFLLGAEAEEIDMSEMSMEVRRLQAIINTLEDKLIELSTALNQKCQEVERLRRENAELRAEGAGF